VSEPVIGLLEEEWTRLDELCSSLDEADWSRPTDCPGWTVQDQLAHVIGTESMLAGRATPPADDATLGAEHVHNEIGRFNEAWVSSLRERTPAEVLAVFRSLMAERLDQLRGYPSERFDEVGPSPVGQVPYREFMRVRAMDTWVHEQDIRRAVGRSGHQRGPVVEVALERFVAAMPFVVGKKAGAPEGSSVRFDLHGEAARTFAVVMEGGRGRVTPEPPPDPAATLSMPAETWWCLCLGRWDVARARSEGLSMAGDQDLGRKVAEQLTFMI
jgi:uncharacterized protein (TIGR03083 family)